jgi:serine phosphatase RsbU (regulator of sigma subunit)/CHASE3 domain sensor protein
VAVAMRDKQYRLAVSLSEGGKGRFKSLGRSARIRFVMKCHGHKTVAHSQQRRADREAVGRRRLSAEEFNEYVASDRLGVSCANHATHIGVDGSTVFVITAADVVPLFRHADPLSECAHLARFRAYTRRIVTSNIPLSTFRDCLPRARFCGVKAPLPSGSCCRCFRKCLTRQMRLRRRLALVAAAYIALMAGTGIAALMTARSRSDHAAEGRSLTVAIDRAGQLRAAYLDMETGVRGYEITADPAFLQPYEVGSRTAADLETEIVAVANPDPTLARDLSLVTTMGTRWLREVAEPTIAARRTSGVDPVPREQSVTGKALFDDLRVSIDQLEKGLLVRRAASDRSRERAARLLSTFVLLAPALSVIFVVVSSRLLTLWILNPLDEMGSAVERIRSGDLAATVPILGPPDVAELGQRVDDMRRTISAQRDRELRARESVEQSALLAIRVRNELAADIGELPPGWTGAASMLPAEGIVAGDCYDVTLLSPTILATVVIDIAGHGGGPAVTALRCKEIVRAALRARMRPGQALAHLAGQVDDLEESFLTAFIATVNTVSGECYYANAGHPPALFQNAGVVEELMPTGPLLGPFPGEWKTERRTIDVGGQLAIYTDGLVEARNAEREFYGMERLTAQVLSVPCVDAQDVIDACFADLKAFRSDRLVDDVTMVIVCRNCPDPKQDV